MDRQTDQRNRESDREIDEESDRDERERGGWGVWEY